MAEASRQFDISWLDEVTKKSATTGGIDTAVLQVLRESDGRAHVVDVAKALDRDFVDVLRSVLQLAGGDYLSIAKRDDLAGDHLVELTPRGSEALQAA